MKNFLLSLPILSALFGNASEAQTDEAKHVELITKVVKHVETTLGPVYSTVSFNMFQTHNLLSIIILSPNKERNYYLLVTAGMSATSDPLGNELVIAMPKSWKAPKNEDDVAKLTDQDKLPLMLLLTLAELPFSHKIDLGTGHTVGASNMLPGFSHIMTHFTMIDPEFEYMSYKSNGHDKGIFFLGVYPITQKEFDAKSNYVDGDAFFGALMEKGVSLMLDLKRHKCGDKMDKSELDILIQEARNGEIGSQNNLGVAYLEGKGVAKNDKKALEWFTKAAEQGLLDAQYNLGLMYYEGIGTSQNWKKAFEWLIKAADQGDVIAQTDIGFMYEKGMGIPQDARRAVEFYKKAAIQGFPKAQYNLGVMYAEGNGVVQDYKQALAWYTKAADQGDAQAQYNLGLMYLEGTGVDQDHKLAFDLFLKAANQGDAPAQNSIGVMYDKGIGIPQDLEKAIVLYTKSANQGYPEAQHNLALMYLDGQGITQDEITALQWFEKAAAQGFPQSQEALAALRGQPDISKLR